MTGGPGGARLVSEASPSLLLPIGVGPFTQLDALQASSAAGPGR